jgi:hypothetical protein
MLNIPAGEKKMPPVARINLKTLLDTSMLGEAGDFGPHPSQTILADNASKQGRAFVPANASASASDPAFSNGAAPANVNSATQAAHTVRSITVANNNPRSQSTAAATTGGGAAATAGIASPPDTTGNGSGSPTAGNAAATATTSPLDTTSSRTVVNRTNNGNRRNIENRGNSGNNANRRNIENRGNGGNSGNPGRE